MSNRRKAVQLTEEEMERCRDIARRRNELPRTEKSKTYAGIDGNLTHLRGIVAELAVVKHYALTLRNVFGKGDDGVDFVTDEGKTLQVKGVPYFTDPVLKLVPKDTKCDYYMLVCVDTDNGYCQIVGTITRAMVLSKEPAKYRPHLPKSRNFHEEELIPPLPRDIKI